jgi:zinc transporter ZupT
MSSHSHSHNASSSEHAVLAALLLHAAADGLAVGVAHMSSSMRLAVSIGMAMVRAVLLLELQSLKESSLISDT